MHLAHAASHFFHMPVQPASAAQRHQHARRHGRSIISSGGRNSVAASRGRCGVSGGVEMAIWRWRQWHQQWRCSKAADGSIGGIGEARRRHQHRKCGRGGQQRLASVVAAWQKKLHGVAQRRCGGKAVRHQQDASRKRRRSSMAKRRKRESGINWQRQEWRRQRKPARRKSTAKAASSASRRAAETQSENARARLYAVWHRRGNGAGARAVIIAAAPRS